jgi:hypothetical protein
MTKKKTLKIAKDFRGSTESRLAVDKIKETDKIKRSIGKIKTEAGFVQVLQDLVDLMVNNSGMKMSPAQTLSAIDRVKRSFQVEEGPMRDLRALIRETLLLESEPATTRTQGTEPAVTGDEEKEKAEKVDRSVERTQKGIEGIKKTPAGKSLERVAQNTKGVESKREEFMSNMIKGLAISNPDKINPGVVQRDLRKIAAKVPKEIEAQQKALEDAEAEEKMRGEDQKTPDSEQNAKQEDEYQFSQSLKNLPK